MINNDNLAVGEANHIFVKKFVYSHLPSGVRNSLGIMKFEQIIADLKNKVYYPVYFLMGEEAYFIDEIADFIAKNVLPPSEKEFNQLTLYGAETNIDVIIQEARRYPMLADYHVVIVKEAQHIVQLEKLLSYIEKPLKSTILVICYKYKTLDRRTEKWKNFFNKIKDIGVVFESKKIYEDKIPEWIQNFLKRKGYKISLKSSVLLADYLGNDLSKIVNELNKLMIVIPQNIEITAEHIEENIGISKDFNNFELNDALGKKNILKANRIVNYFIANPKDYPFEKNIAILYSYFTKILAYHYVQDKDPNIVASILRIHPFTVNNYKIAAKNYSAEKLVNIISLLHEYDARSKGIGNVSTDKGDLLRELIYRILH